MRWNQPFLRGTINPFSSQSFNVNTKIEASMSEAHGHDLVTGLPTTLSCSILSDWVSTVDLVRFDSACCCHEKRGVVLSMFKSKEFLSKDDMRSYAISQTASQYWDWILRRDIKLFHITVRTTEADAEKLEEYARRHEKYIGHLNLIAVKALSFVLCCKHLVRLTCDIDVTPELRTLFQNNPDLQILDVFGLRDEHAESFRNIHMTHLTQLSMDIEECSSVLVAAALTMPARLLRLNLWNVDADLTGVAALCPHLRSLSLYSMNYGPGFNLAEFTSHLPQLVNLQLVNFSELRDTELLAVVRNLNQLRFLNLQFYESCRLTDTGIEYIAEHCAATLEVFGLTLWYSGAKITHVSLDLVRLRCTKLRQFHVEAPLGQRDVIPLESVTTLLVEEICEDINLACPQVEILRFMYGATDCSLPNLRELCRKCPKLHRVEVEKASLSYMKSLAATLPHLLITEKFSHCLDAITMPI